ncbi:hypothetical protein LOTGIDRAFT_201620 [Lottia gigantea]|uniref:N-acetyltransferase domain-containing protein n=1 Tax=Lottia gigantea TaxID=225164 RepID=V4AN22_LOTGI|nr:hypothetical protein LOTGIDRAFT_201620 [Lottia gigantea]ESO98552.1 hypothetical protein LOTGIDRAFT_201620 [Lottia gigantea]
MAYIIKSKQSNINLKYLPKVFKSKNGDNVKIGRYQESDEAELHEILKYIINIEGDSYPQIDISSVEDFRAYYLSHDVFVCKNDSTGEILGSFYVKPNFPGRCSHICNGGFAVKKSARGNGLATKMTDIFLQVARDLGYRAVMFNLVFVSNEFAIKIYRKLGFKEIGRIPSAGDLKDKGYMDAIQFHYDLLTIDKSV